MLSSTERSISFYQNSSVWLDIQDSRSWDKVQNRIWLNKKKLENWLTYFPRKITSSELICILHIYIYIYIFIYIYMCVCVCVCVCVCNNIHMYFITYRYISSRIIWFTCFAIGISWELIYIYTLQVKIILTP